MWGAAIYKDIRSQDLLQGSTLPTTTCNQNNPTVKDVRNYI